MKNRGFILPALTGFAVSALFIFMSCASQEANTEDDPLAELGTETSEGTTAKNKDKGGDVTNDPALADLGGDAALEKGGQGLGLPSEEEMAKTAEGGGLADIPSDTGRKKGSPPTEDLSNDPALGDALGLPSDNDIAKQEREDRKNEARTAQLGSGPNVGGGGQSPEAMWSGNSRVPAIPQSAIKRKGQTLNRFYFLRKGDTPDSVSELLYASAGKAKELKAWNRGAWRAGKLLFYKSPNSPDDSQMQSFYKERGIQNGEYQIKKGDWLSRVAKQLLGDAGSWKEIAVINGLPSADAIEVGQRIAMYPADLRGGSPVSTQGEAPQTAANPPPNPGTPAADPNTPPSFQADPAVQFAPPVPAGGPNRRMPKQGFDLSRFLQQELLTIVLGLVGLVCVVVLLMANKRRKARQSVSDDVNDDIFGAGGK